LWIQERGEFIVKYFLISSCLVLTFILGIIVGFFLLSSEVETDIPQTAISSHPTGVFDGSKQILQEDGREEVPGPHTKRFEQIREAQSLDVDGLVRKIQSLYSRQMVYRTTNNAADIYVDSLIALDPEAGLNMYKSRPILIEFLHHYFRRWIEQDLEGAAEYYLSHQHEKVLGRMLLQSQDIELSGSLSALMTAYGYGAEDIIESSRLGRLDPAQAFEMLIDDVKLQKDYRLTNSIARRLDRADLDYWLGRTQELVDRGARQQFLRALIGPEASLNPEEFFLRLNQMFDQDHRDRAFVMQAFTSKAGDGAEGIIIEYARSIEDYDLLLGQLSNIARRDPEAAFEMFTDIPDGTLTFGRAHQFASSISEVDPERVYKWLQSVSGQYPVLRQAVLRNLSRKDIGFLREKLKGETDAGMNATLVQYVVRAEAETDPVSALAMLREYSDVKTYSKTLRSITSDWANRDPKAYLSYALDNEGVEGLLNAVSDATMSWYSDHPEEAMDWVSSIERSDIYDLGVQGIAMQLANKDPRAALAMSDSISDDRKEFVRLQITANWVLQDKSQLEQILAEVKLSEASEVRIRQYADRM